MAEIHRRRGRIRLHLDAAERQAIGSVIDRLSPLLGQVPRTRPVAYAEPGMQREYERWVRPDVERGRDADLAVIRDCVAAGEDLSPLTEAQALAWVRGLNHLRLVAGGLLGIEEDGWYAQASKAEQRTAEYGILMALGMLQEEMVAALEG